MTDIQIRFYEESDAPALYEAAGGRMSQRCGAIGGRSSALVRNAG